ncbi:hypothetical protein ACJ73_07879 [Blastomyces percursus]|uniref:Uncharacterized protein n=1 Tax=Blastomyces percursus TaxID=1658174 RepID=A0A1J9QKN9_9EURO|nr:hypothetical protein ACJ73_07879 [Blastomyces percursus]
MASRIRSVLDPEITTTESQEFQHWPKTMFTLCPTCSPTLSEPRVPALKGFPHVIEFDKRMARFIQCLPNELGDKAIISRSMAGKIGKRSLMTLQNQKRMLNLNRHE